MKKYILPLVVLLLTVSIGCKKYNDPLPQEQPPLPLPDDDVRTVLLKDINAQSLPGPYYHFTYDSLHYVKQISFASDFAVYEVKYENKRVVMMTNSVNDNVFIYHYTNNLVTEINEFSGITVNKLYSYRLSYNSSNQLSQVNWVFFSGNGAKDTVKKEVLTYLPTGNLAAIDHYYSTSPGQPLEWLSRDEFSDYDNRINVDDFSVLKKDFFSAYLFLPGVRLQKNNPGRQHIVAGGNEFDIRYSYQYQNGLPVSKTATITEKIGTVIQEPKTVTTQFSYY
jgi:hypothetical protein